MDVVKYAHKNRTWTVQHVHYYSEALAIGLLENGFRTGDVVLSYLPAHLSEQVRTANCFCPTRNRKKSLVACCNWVLTLSLFAYSRRRAFRFFYAACTDGPPIRLRQGGPGFVHS
jgi:hypothetical protein